MSQETERVRSSVAYVMELRARAERAEARVRELEALYDDTVGRLHETGKGATVLRADLARARGLLEQAARYFKFLAREPGSVLNPDVARDWLAAFLAGGPPPAPTGLQVQAESVAGQYRPAPAPRTHCAACDEPWPHPGKLCEPRDVDYLNAAPPPACTCYLSKADPPDHAPDCPARR